VLGARYEDAMLVETGVDVLIGVAASGHASSLGLGTLRPVRAS
jgi:hypothetical protein